MIPGSKERSNVATNPQITRSSGYEKRDASPRGLLYVVLMTTGFLGLTCLSLIWLFDHFEKTQNPGSFVAAPFAGPRSLPSPPRIQPDPGVDLQSYRESQQNLLNTYGWVDRQNGVVRMPVDRAMELLLQRGLPTRATNKQQDASPREEHSSSDPAANGKTVP
jgi:hypothetical protein